jgi:pimeloyl-ACP methyl ester carboxylesterase
MLASRVNVPNGDGMKNYRTYGNAPFTVAVLHGGPGAAGEMAPVARELSDEWGVLEPLQTAATVRGQEAELHAVLEIHAELPVALVGYSWGAWLGLMAAARQPDMVRKLILVGSGPFEEKYAAMLTEARDSRLSPAERDEFADIAAVLGAAGSADEDRLLARLAALAAKTDSYDPLPMDGPVSGEVVLRGDIFRRVWPEAARLRRSGELVDLAGSVRCPVTAIHGEDDPHPAEGVRAPLAAVLDDFRFIRLRQCGHTPWKERRARNAFYRILRRELR